MTKENKGKGQRINMGLDHLGDLKQAPYLIKAIKSIMPKIDLVAYVNEDNENDISRIFRESLSYERISQYLIKIKKWSSLLPKQENTLNISIRFFEREIYNEYNDSLEFWIDPLKFEKRRLLNKKEIKRLKKDIH